MTDWPVLACLSPAERAAVLTGGRPRRYDRGELIIRYGEPVECLQLVRQGRASVGVPTASGEQMILNVRGPGSILGEQAALVEEADWAITATAIEPCRTLSLRRSQVHALLEQHPGINAYLLDSLSAQLRDVHTRLIEFAFLPTAGRVCRRLLELQTEFGSESIRITQRDLACMAGTSRATVNAVLREFERRGLVRNGHGRLRILDPDALRRRMGRST